MLNWSHGEVIITATMDLAFQESEPWLAVAQPCRQSACANCQPIATPHFMNGRAEFLPCTHYLERMKCLKPDILMGLRN